MIIPGVIISTLLCILLSFKYYNIWLECGNEKYGIFFIFSYLLGVVLQQIGDVIDEKILYKYKYGGNPRDIFLQRDRYFKIINVDMTYEDILQVKKIIVDDCRINNNGEKNILNRAVFSYCLNIIEMNGLTYKSDKMLVISEMSRSLSIGFLVAMVLNICLIFVKRSGYIIFLYRRNNFISIVFSLLL